jgi:hypothetical protein
MSEEYKKIELKDESIIINKIIIDDLNTYKIINDIKEDKREDFIKKAIVIGAIGLRNLYLTENVDYIEKEFKELMKNSEIQSKDVKDMIEKTFDIENNSSSLGKMRVLFEDYFDKRLNQARYTLEKLESRHRTPLSIFSKNIILCNKTATKLIRAILIPLSTIFFWCGLRLNVLIIFLIKEFFNETSNFDHYIFFIIFQ